MIAKVDANLCAATGVCVSECPQVFEIKNGVSTVKVSPIPSELEDKVRKAVDWCPTGAISVEE